ncbi:MAG: hypothetical protein LRY36_01230 [Alphaproteobacteria bacterium]|nr:hypothetical protein [Alphaproteobacteria bacterium]
MDLAQTFGHFVGQTIQNPDRVTCDFDPVAGDIQATAYKNGLMLTFAKNANWTGPGFGGKAVIAYIDKADDSGKTWTITRFALS